MPLSPRLYFFHLGKILCQLMMLVFISQTYINAQTEEIDTLKSQWRKAEDDTTKIRALYLLAYAFFDHSLDSASLYAEKCFSIGRKATSAKFKCSSYAIKGTTFLYQNEYDSSLHYLERAISIAKEGDLPKQASSFYTNIGILYKRQRLYDRAIEQYFKGLVIDEQRNDTYGIIVSKLNLANLYMEMQEFEKSLAMNYDALQLIPDLEHQDKSHLHGLLYNNIGTGLLQVYRFEDALKNFKLALEINEADGNKNEISRNLQNIGSTLEKWEQEEQSIPYLERALAIRRQVSDEVGLVETHLQLATSLGKLDHDSESRIHFDSAIGFAESIDDKSLLSEIYLAKSNVFESQGKLGLALEAFKQASNYEDSLENEFSEEVLIEMETKYNTSKKDLEIATQQLTITKQTSQRNLLLSVITLIFLISWFLIYRYRKNQKLQKEKIQNLEKYQKILVMDSMLQGQEEERKRIAQDLHDGLGTLLVSASLQVQNAHRQLQKIMESPILKNTENIIDNACKEVRRIAHDMMPSALIDLGFVEAIGDLLTDISSQQSIQIEFSAPDPMPIIEGASSLNLYRIIQEILQNVVKHAQAKVVGVNILVEEEKQLIIEISDDGVGFQTDSETDGIGLRNIRSRTEYLNGQLGLESKPGEGCTYIINVPIST